jgi:hypothetical protein
MPLLTKRQVERNKKHGQKEKMMLKKQQQAFQKASVAHDREQGLSEPEVQRRKKERQDEFQSHKPQMVREMDRVAAEWLHETPEQMELDDLAAQWNSRQEGPE